MSKHKKFLEFNGKNILFLNKEGQWWVAIKPICEALNVDPFRSIKNIKKDPILGPEWSKQAVQVSKNGNSQLRKMTCLTEKFIYGWIFSLRSDSPELIEYKKTCYELLFNHFHGTIGNRKEMLLERGEVDNEIYQIKEELKSDDRIQRLNELTQTRKSLSTELNKNDVQNMQSEMSFN